MRHTMLWTRISLVLAASGFVYGQTSTSSSPTAYYTISATNITAVYTPYGARLVSCLVNDRDGKQQDIHLGYDDGADYITDTETNHTYFGAVVGRYANRIKNGTFVLDGDVYHIPTNENGGKDTLHGGDVGYDQRNWTVLAVNESSVVFQLLDDNFQGFPGKVLTTAQYSVGVYASGPQGQLRPRLTTKLISMALDHATPIMLSTHHYWNLNAFKAADVRDDTTLWMPYSKRHVRVDPILVPTGDLGLVKDVPSIDFTSPKTFGQAISNATGVCGAGCTGVDNAFIIDRPAYTSPTDLGFPTLSLWSSITGIQMDASSNQLGWQIYTCNGQNGSIKVKQSQVDRNAGISSSTDVVNKYGCYAVEPQQYIDGINNPQWGVDEYEIYTPESGPAVNHATYDFSTF